MNIKETDLAASTKSAALRHELGENKKAIWKSNVHTRT